VLINLCRIQSRSSSEYLPFRQSSKLRCCVLEGRKHEPDWKCSAHTHYWPSAVMASTHTRLTALFPGLPMWASIRKVKQSGLYWSKRQWVAVESAGPYASLHLAQDRQPCQHPTTLSFLQAGCHSCRPTNSVKALKANNNAQSTKGIMINNKSHTV